MAAALFTSCNKDDMLLIQKPYRLQGELSPSFGLPVISSDTMNLNDLLMSFDGTFEGLITDDNTITFEYKDTIRETIPIGGMIAKGGRRGGLRTTHHPKSVVPFIARDTVIEYTLPIDFFDKADMQAIVDGNISIHELQFNLDAYVQGSCPANVDSALRAYVNARFDNVTIKYVGHDNVMRTFTGFASQSLMLNDIIQGGTLEFDSVNLADIINSMPRSITAGFHLHVEVDSGLVLDNLGLLTDTTGINSFNALLDSLRMTSITIGANMKVLLPFEIMIGELPYSYDLELKGNDNTSDTSTAASIFDVLDSTLTKLLGEGAVSMDSSKVSAILKFQNGIPLDLTLSGTLVDANDMETYVLFANRKIASAVTGPVDGRPGVTQAVRDSATIVELPLSVEALDKLTKASKLRLRLVLATSNDNTFKMIKRDDYLKVKMMVKLDPSIQIDMQFFDGFGNMFNGIPVIGGLLNGN